MATWSKEWKDRQHAKIKYEYFPVVSLIGVSQEAAPLEALIAAEVVRKLKTVHRPSVRALKKVVKIRQTARQMGKTVAQS